MSLKYLTLAAFVSVVGVLSASCWFSSPSALSAVRDATGRALDSDSVRFELATSIEGAISTADAEEFSLKASGAVDADAERSVFVFEAYGFSMELRQVDGMVYLRMTDDDEWMAMDADEFSDIQELFMPFFDPYSLLEEMGVDPASAELEGTDEIRGEDAKRYRIDVPARDFDQELDSFLPVAKDASVLLWIGESGLPVKLVVESTGEGERFGVGGGEVTARVTIEFFDYGKPVDVEAPPEDQIADMPDFGFDAGGSYDDPFEGADCYGHRVDECLAPNPEVEAMAQDPIVCQAYDVRVCIVPMGYVRADVIRAVVDFHKTTKNIDVVVLPGITLSAGDVDPTESALTTTAMSDLMRKTYITTGTASTFIGISGIEQMQDGGGWWFGHRFVQSGFSDQHGMFSYFRMENVEPYNGEPITDELVQLRVTKYVARYTALLLLDFPYTEDPDYLNYYEMYGFSDLDSMGTKWPEGTPPCLGPDRVVCVIPDRQHEDPKFEADVFAAAERITRETGVRVDVRSDSLSYIYAPSKPDWGKEYTDDLVATIRSQYHYPLFPIVGVTDDNLAQDSSVSPKIDEPHPMLNLSVVSGYGAGKPGTPEHRERIYRLVLRGVLVAQFGMELNDDPNSLMFRGITTVAGLDGKVIPAIPR